LRRRKNVFQDSAEDVGVDVAVVLAAVGSGMIVAVVDVGVVKGATSIGGVFVVDVDALRRDVSCNGRCGRRHAILIVDVVEWTEERLAMA